MSSNDWEPVIGLEIHAQLSTASKMFSPDSASFGGMDNEFIDPVSLGLPGALPVPNEKALRYSIMIGLALDCKIAPKSVFARKNYFYPDLPKGYQISQYESPLCQDGKIEFFFNGEWRQVGIERAHMEEDAGKSTHHGDYTLINLNRAGVPLLEIVSRPEIKTAGEAAEYAKAIRRTLRYLGACDGNLEEGSLRCDCNVSVKRPSSAKLGTRVEIKNINSFRFIEKAIEYEIQRQIDVLECGEKIVQETRLYDSTKNATFSMRGKEEAHDYRYFPDPDLLPVAVAEMEVLKIRSALTESPAHRQKRFTKDLQLTHQEASQLTEERDLADYFEKTLAVCGDSKAAAAWIMTELQRELNYEGRSAEDSKISPENLGQLIRMVGSGRISGKIAKEVFSEMWKTGAGPEKIVEAKGWSQVSDQGVIESWVLEVLGRNAGQVAEYRSGRTKLFGFFVGQVMKTSKGQANPDLVNEILKKHLGPES